MFCFRYTSCICNHKTTILSYRMGQKLSSKLLFIYSPNSDRFYIFYISQGSVATQLRCGGMLSNHFITNFQQNAPVEKFWKSVNIWQRYGQNFVAYFFWGHPVNVRFTYLLTYLLTYYNFGGSGRNLMNLYQGTWLEAGVIKWTLILQGVPLTKFGKAKNVQNYARFLTTFDFDRGYLRKGSTNRKSER